MGFTPIPLSFNVSEIEISYVGPLETTVSERSNRSVVGFLSLERDFFSFARSSRIEGLEGFICLLEGAKCGCAWEVVSMATGIHDVKATVDARPRKGFIPPPPLDNKPGV